MVLKMLMSVAGLWFPLVCLAGGCNGADTGLTVEFFGNSVMRGAPAAVRTLSNGFNISLEHIFANSTSSFDAEQTSVRVSGTLTADTFNTWYRFGVNVGSDNCWVRLWIDDHRLVDQWSNGGTSTPLTNSLLPNVSMTSRPVSLRVDLRPNSTNAFLQLLWSSDSNPKQRLIPESQFSPVVSEQQQKRRNLQERTATGWNQWYRGSNLAQVAVQAHTITLDYNGHGRTARSCVFHEQCRTQQQ